VSQIPKFEGIDKEVSDHFYSHPPGSKFICHTWGMQAPEGLGDASSDTSGDTTSNTTSPQKKNQKAKNTAGASQKKSSHVNANPSRGLLLSSYRTDTKVPNYTTLRIDLNTLRNKGKTGGNLLRTLVR
jgi:hypothetical protein